MTRRIVRRLVLALCAALPGIARGQTSGSVFITGPAGNPLHDGTPAFTITTSGFTPAELPLQLTLQIATRSDFGGALLADTTVAGSAASILLPHLLPEKVNVWWRARVTTAKGALVLSDATGPRTTAAWLTLLSPNGPIGSTVASKTPTFVWSSAKVAPSLPPWIYRITVIRAVTRLSDLSASSLADTTFRTPVELEANNPYTWQVTATRATGDSITVKSQSTFTILDPNAPIATTLFPNFPNPFPNAKVQATCIWFDLRVQSDVQLDVFDMRGNHVVRILPGRGLGTTIPAGRWGRAAEGSNSGCDERLTWDGRADDGRDVPPGVYIIRFRGDGQTFQRVAVWKGR